MFKNIEEIVFITSESCNLHCSYCHLAKHATERHWQETQNIKNALISGQYLQMYKDFVNQYNININKIHRFSLWGQEPTITLEAFNTQIPDILDWLYNSQTCIIPTNLIAYPDKIVNCIKIFNNYFKEINRRFVLHFQISFDGLDYTENSRGVNPNIIISNIKKIINEINDLVINNNFRVEFCLHGVLTMEHVQLQLNDQNAYDRYWKSNSLLVQELKKLIYNPKIHFLKFSAFFVDPYNATKKEGQQYNQYAHRCLNDFMKKVPLDQDCILVSPFIQIIQGMQYTYMTTIMENNNNIQINNNNISNLYNIDYEDNHIINYFLNRQYGCGPNNFLLKLRYDGTILYCEHTMFDLDIDDIKDNEQFDYNLAYYTLQHKNFQPNIYKSSQDNINNFIKLFDLENIYVFLYSYSNTVNLMYLLLQNHQIDQSYNDFNKLLKHAIYLTMGRQCYYVSYSEMGDFYIKFLGYIRLCCNGLLDYIENLFLTNQLDYMERLM